MDKSTAQTQRLKKTLSPISERLASNPVIREAADIVAHINQFNSHKTTNRLYSGYLHQKFHTDKAVDYHELINNINNTVQRAASVEDLAAAIHNIFTGVLNSSFTAYGLYHENSRCINLKLQNAAGSTYSSKIFISDELNPIVECFKTGKPIIKDNNRFLNIPYFQNSQALILPLKTVNKCIGIAILGKNNVKDDVGLFSFIANYCAMFTDNVMLTETACKYANTDNTTGLLNHRGFQEVLAREIDCAEQKKTNLSVAIFDINNISKINRELGHAKGDEVIKLLAGKVKQNLRSADIAGRYGGDEIAVILPDTSSTDAKYFSEYITYCLSCCFVDDVGPIKVSVGISTYPECTKDQEKLLILAEQAACISQAKGYERGMSAIVSSSDFNFWDDEALHSFAHVITKRHSQLGINYEEELVSKFNNEQLNSHHSLIETATSLAGAIDAKDPYTKDHSASVSRYSEALARAINLPEAEVERIKLGALLHDVGKIGIPESVLHKTSQLSDEEWEIMKQHPVIGAEKVLEPNEALRDLIPIVKYHHEHIDGNGYPEQLRGEQIPLAARIVSVADAFHALISDRPYRKGLGVEKACEILKMGAGIQWDSDLVRHFINLAPALSTTV